MDIISLQFTDPLARNKEELSWDISSSGLAQKWAKEMLLAIQNSSMVREQKFFGWGTHRDKFLISQINRSIEEINFYFGSKYFIKERAHEKMDQSELNALHHHFEILMGQSWKRSDYLDGAPVKVHLAVRALNDLVHELEFSEGAKSNRMNGGFQFQLVPYRQIDLHDYNLKEFSFENEPGNLVTSYCQLGKTWADVYLDGDQDIHPENISPLRYYSSSFVANFYRCSYRDAADFRQKIQAFMLERANKSGISVNLEDPKNALGFAKYATLTKDSPVFRWSDSDLRNFFSSHNSITKISLQSGSQSISRAFPIHDTLLGEEAIGVPL